MIHVLCITLGGKREDRIKEMFASSSDDFILTFCQGVEQRQLRSKKGLLKTLKAVGLLVDDNEETHEACWRAMRHLSRDRAVLACTLAHIRAMSICIESETSAHPIDVIIEDNVRGPISANICAERIRAVAATTTSSTVPDADLTYFAYGGRASEIEEWMSALKLEDDDLLDHQQQSWTEWPQKKLSTSSDIQASKPKVANILWGLMAYKPSKRLFTILLEEIRADLPGSLAWQPKRSQQQIAKPVDKIVPKYCLKRQLNIRVSKKPAFFRAPIRSTIHPKLDAQFRATTEVQITNTGLTWKDLDLSEEEAKLLEMSSDGNPEKKEQGEDEQEDRRGWSCAQQERKQRQVPTLAVKIECKGCGVLFPSKNKLFKHLKSDENSC